MIKPRKNEQLFNKYHGTLVRYYKFMNMHFLSVLLITTLYAKFNILAEKLDLDTLNNYSEFLNFGDKKLHKINKGNLENSIFKSKIDILGNIFKTNIDSIKLSPKLDIVFLIDASSSVGENNFKSELKFVKKLLSDVTVDYNHTKVAIVTFSSSNNVVSRTYLQLIYLSTLIIITLIIFLFVNSDKNV